MRGREIRTATNLPALIPFLTAPNGKAVLGDPGLDQLADGGDGIYFQADLDHDVMRGGRLLDQHARALRSAWKD